MGKSLTEEEFWLDFKEVLFSEEKIEEAEEEIEKIIKLGKFEEGDRILDMPCGLGRHSKELERKGFEVVGVEKTQDYVEDARENTESAEIVKKDMKNFKRGRSFDAAINWWNSFGYFEEKSDDLKMLENIQKSLKEGGVLLMDLFGKEISALTGFSSHWSREEDSILLQDHEIKDNWKKIENTWIKVKEGEVVEYVWQQRLYSAHELEQLLKEAGFSQIEFFGNLEKEPYNHEADRMIVKAEK